MIVKYITNDNLIIKTPAKLNLFLEVLNKREDGYHNINSLFQSVSLYDSLNIKVTDKPGVEINLFGDSGLTVGTDNLISKAYYKLAEKHFLKSGIEVRLDKKIPIAAGLAGGSADAAATIYACNLLFDMNLSLSEMAQAGFEIGSDIPFFFSSGQALVSGRGEIIENSDFPTDYHIVLVKPALSFSTPEGYRALKRGLTKSKNPFNLAPCRTVEELINQLRLTGNDFEDIHFDSFEELQTIKGELLQLGAHFARMSGSGPTMFGIFTEIPDIPGSGLLKNSDWLVNTVGPVKLFEHDSQEGGNRGDNRNSGNAP